MHISIEKAKKEKLFYFVATGIIYRASDRRCLLLKRSEKEIAHPGLWSGVGGKLEWKDFEQTPITRMNHDIPNWEGVIENLLIREAKEESGLQVTDPKYIKSIGFLRPDGVPVICAKFALKYESGDVEIPPEFDDFAWINLEEVKTYQPIIAGIAAEVAAAIVLYRE